MNAGANAIRSVHVPKPHAIVGKPLLAAGRRTTWRRPPYQGGVPRMAGVRPSRTGHA